MKKSYLTVVLTLTCLLGLRASAHAQDEGTLVVNVPFEFVAGRNAFPAGTYNISRVSSPTHQALVIRSSDNSAFLLPIDFDGASVDHAQLAFEHVGDKYLLSKIETPAGVYTIGIARTMPKVARRKDHDAMSSSGAN